MAETSQRADEPGHEREPFNEFAQRRMRELDYSPYRLAEKLRVSRSTVSRWLTKNEWTHGKFRRVCELLRVAEFHGLEEFGHAHAPEYFQIAFTAKSKYRTQGYEDSLSKRLGDIDTSLRHSMRALRETSRELKNVFGGMEDGNLLVVFSASVLPLIYRTAHESAVAACTWQALRRGLLVCVIVPTEKYTKKLRRYGFTDLETPLGFRTQLNLFRRRGAEHYRSEQVPEDNINEYLHGRLQQIEVDWSPWFTPGFAYSLFGEFVSAGSPVYRGGMRTPEDAFGDWTLFPKAPRLEERLRKAARQHLRSTIKGDVLPGQAADGRNADPALAELRRKCLERLASVLRKK